MYFGEHREGYFWGHREGYFWRHRVGCTVGGMGRGTFGA